MTEVKEELGVLVTAAREGASSQLYETTQKRLTAAIGHLTFALRTLRSEKVHNQDAILADFLLRTVPCALAVFQSVLATYDLNYDTCQRTVVFLGLLYSVPLPLYVDRHSATALRNTLAAIPQCFFNFACAGRTADVRCLLNTLFLVAGGTVTGNGARSSYWNMFTFPSLLFRQKQEEEDHFVKALRALLAGWIAASKTLESWTPVQYLDIAEAVSMALEMRLDGAKTREEILTLTARIHSAARRDAGDHRGLTCLVPIAFASGVLKALDGHDLGDDVPLLAELFESIKKVTVRQNTSLRNFRGKASLTSFNRTDCGTLSAAFLIFRVAHPLATRLSVEEVEAFRTALEVLMRCATGADSDAEMDLFHRQLQWCVTSYSEMLGSAYSSFISREDRYEDCSEYLQALASGNSSSSTVGRFLFSTAMNMDCEPLTAARLLDSMSMLDNKTPHMFRESSGKLGPVLADGKDALSSLLQIVIALRDTLSTHAGKSRLSFLLHAIRSAVVSKSQAQNLRDQASRLEGGEEENTLSHLWALFASTVRNSLFSNVAHNSYAAACIACLAEVIRSRDPALSAAQKSLLLEFPASLIEDYLHAGNPSSQQSRLVQVLSVFDAMTTCSDRSILQASIDRVLYAVESLDEKRHRLVCVILLRLMARCNLEVLDVVIAGVGKLIGTDKERKLQFLPVVRIAVLGTDTVRKDACVAWLLRFFRDVSGMATPGMVTRRASRKAKL